MKTPIYEVYKDATGVIQCSQHLTPAVYNWQACYHVTGWSEIIEGEPVTHDNVWMFYANPKTYPAEHEDIYGVPLGAETVDEHCRKFITQQCHNFRDLQVERL